MTAVRKKTAVSERVDPTTLRIVASDTMRAAVTISTPASAARGISATTFAAR